MKAEIMRQFSVQELKQKLQELRKEFFIVKSEFAFARKLDKPHLLRAYRKDIARICTVLRAKELEAN